VLRFIFPPSFRAGFYAHSEVWQGGKVGLLSLSASHQQLVRYISSPIGASL